MRLTRTSRKAPVALAVVAALAFAPVAAYAADEASAAEADPVVVAEVVPTASTPLTEGRIEGPAFVSIDLADVVANDPDGFYALNIAVNDGAEYIMADKPIMSDESVITTYVGDGQLSVSGLKQGVSTLSFLLTDASDPENVVETNTIEITVYDSREAKDEYRLFVDTGDEWGGLSDGWVSSDRMFEQSAEETLRANGYDFEVGEAVRLGDGNYYYFQGWEVEGGAFAIDEVPAKGAFVSTGYTYHDGATLRFMDCAVRALWSSEPTPEPEPETNYRVNQQGNTITFPNTPEWNFDWVLVTDHIGGDAAQTATDAVVDAVDGVTGHPYVSDSYLDSYGTDVEVPEGDTVTVTLRIPEGLSADGLHVFHVDGAKVTDMNATVDAKAGTVSFETTHFSTFVLANVEADEQPAVEETTDDQKPGEKPEGLAKTGDAGSAVALLAALSGSATLAGAAALRRRR